jgi:hypothetical protein
MKRKSPKTAMVNLSEQVVEQLLRMADAAEAFSYGLVDAEFLADQVKMTKRALSFFNGKDITEMLKVVGGRHPHLVKVWEEERGRVVRKLKEG